MLTTSAANFSKILQEKMRQVHIRASITFSSLKITKGFHLFY